MSPAPRADRWASFEQRVGKRWTTWAGSLLLFIAAALFVKMWVGRGGGSWFTAPWRIAAASGFGALLLFLGHRATTKRFRVLGQGLLGTGLAVLYLAVFAGLAYYHLYPRELAFAMLIAITAGGTLLAVRHDALPIALLALLGGLVTPLLVSSGSGERDALFAYLTILDFGVLVVSLRKGWRSLDVIAVAGTWVLFLGWYGAHFEPAAMTPTLAWLGVLFGVLVGMPFAHHLRRRAPIGDARFVLAIANAFATLGCAHAVLGPHVHALSLVALVMAAVYGALGVLTRRRLPDDARATFGFLVLATAFLTLAVPLRLERHGITLAWALEGPILCYLGLRFRYFPGRLAGMIVLALAAMALLALPVANLAYAWPFANARFLTALCVPAAAALYALVMHRRRGETGPDDRALLVVAALAAVAIALPLVHHELHQALHARGIAATAPWAVVAPWIAATLAFLRLGTRLPSEAGFLLGLTTATGAVALAFTSYAMADAPAQLLYLNARFLLAAGAVGLAGVIAWTARVRGDHGAARVAVVIALIALWSLLTVETHRHFALGGPTDAARWAGSMALTSVWGVFALALVGAGFRFRARALRVAGLLLFAVTAGKLALVDLSTVQEGYRVLSFLVIGVLMIAASYLYHRLERWLLA